MDEGELTEARVSGTTEFRERYYQPLGLLSSARIVSRIISLDKPYLLIAALPVLNDKIPARWGHRYSANPFANPVNGVVWATVPKYGQSPLGFVAPSRSVSTVPPDFGTEDQAHT